MPNDYIKDIGDYIKNVEQIDDGAEALLFRGQDCGKPLLPRIARPSPEMNSIRKERKMLEEFKRRTARNPELLGQDDWDALVVSQHFRMPTQKSPIITPAKDYVKILNDSNSHRCQLKKSHSTYGQCEERPE